MPFSGSQWLFVLPAVWMFGTGGLFEFSYTKIQCVINVENKRDLQKCGLELEKLVDFFLWSFPLVEPAFFCLSSQIIFLFMRFP